MTPTSLPPEIVAKIEKEAEEFSRQPLHPIVKKDLMAARPDKLKITRGIEVNAYRDGATVWALRAEKLRQELRFYSIPINYSVYGDSEDMNKFVEILCEKALYALAEYRKDLEG